MRKQIMAVLVIVLFSFGIISFLVGCDNLPWPKKAKPVEKKVEPVAKVEGTVLVKVNDTVITIEDFNKRIDNIKTVYPDIKLEEFNDKKVFLDELVKRELLYQEALSRELEEKQEVVDAIEDFKHEVLAAQLIDQETADIRVEANEIESYYNTFKDEFTAAEERKVREIIVPTEEKAREVLIELLRGQDFANLARVSSISPSAKEGGDLGLIKKGERQGRFNDIVFALAVGEVSNIFKVPEGYAIVKLEEKKGGESCSLSDAWSDIEDGLLRLKKYEKILKLQDELIKKAKIERREDLLR